jgi:ferric-dicitrate binding protein FerR (iron transport regulator)
MKNKLMVIAVLFAMSAAAWGQDAVIREIRGTVEIKAPGASEWVPARPGTVLAKDASISTGFRSTALVVLGNSTLTVRPLTRLRLDELAEAQGREQVSLNLQTGRVRAEVTPPSGGKTDFTVRSPSATASVRGTIFEFDGINLSVIDSTVRLSGPNGRSVLVDAGGTSFINEATGQAAAPLEIAAAVLTPELPHGSESGAAITVEKIVTTTEEPAVRNSIGVEVGW